MLKTFGLELISLVNSDPSWKVSKGSRSESRRARKAVGNSLKDSEGFFSKSSEASDMPVSESEKRGASILDCSFSEKAEYVPIKKRRFLLRCSSPPSTPPVVSSEPTEEALSSKKSNDTTNKPATTDSASSYSNVRKVVDNNISTDDQKSEKDNRRFANDGDFSGIDILAAAACSSSWGRVSGDAEDDSGVEVSVAQGHAHEVAVISEAPSSRGLLKEELVTEMSTVGASCVSPEPVKGLASTSATVKSAREVTSGEGFKGVLKVDSLIASDDGSCHKDEETLGTQKTCSRDDRLNWDLNVAMDAWEHPLESPTGNSDVPCNLLAGAGKSNHNDNAQSLEGCDLHHKVVTTFCAGNFVSPGGSRALVTESLEENKAADHSLHNCHDASQAMGFNERSLLSDCNSNVAAEDCKSMSYDRAIKSTDVALDVASNLATFLPTSGAITEDDGISLRSLKLRSDQHFKGRPILESLNLNANRSCCASENLSISCTSKDMQSSHSVSTCPDIQREVIPNLAVLGNTRSCSESQYGVNAVTKIDGMNTSEHLEPAHITSDSDSLPHPTCSEVHNAPTARCELPLALDAKFQGESSVHGDDTKVNVFEISFQSKETCDTSKANLDNSVICSDKIEDAKPPNRNDGADVSSCPVSSVGNDGRTELREDIDSLYEDGEVREPSEHPREEYDGMDREAEHVDYEPDDMEACTSIDYMVSESGKIEDVENYGPGVAAAVSSTVCDTVEEIRGESTNPVGDYNAHEQAAKVVLNNPPEEKMKTSGTEELPEGRSTSSDMDIALSDDNGGKDRSASHPETVVESKPFRRGLQSRIEGPVTHDTSSQDERPDKMEFRYEESGSMRYFERPRYSFHNQARRRQTDNWNSFPGNRRGGLRRRYSPVIHRHSKPDDDAIVERHDIGYVDGLDDGSYSHQLNPRGRPGADEDEYTGLHPRYKPNRAFSPGRPSNFGRGRSIRYGSFTDDRAGRGRYNGPSPDERFQSSLRYRRPLSRRERSFSPPGGRAHSNGHHSREKSPSEPRSRSPIMWNSSRGRLGAGRGGGNFVRQRSRSPNFRTDARMQKLRSVHHQPDFGPDHGSGFRSIPRSHGSSPQGRWISPGKEEMGHFRDFGYKQRTSGPERSPGRIRSRGDRPGVVDSPRNFKPEVYYRVSEDAAGRGLGYEGNYEGRTKHYGPLRTMRRSYDDDNGIGGRLHQDIDDSPMAKGIRDRDSDFQGRGLRGMDNRISDPTRRFQAEQHSFVCERDGKFNPTSKRFGGDMMDPSHNLNSGEQYRSSCTGRFSNLDDLNRGRRYENFGDRRRHYDPMKRFDAVGSEKRSSHSLDGNFQDDSEFCGRGMRGFDGQVGGHSTRLRDDKDSGVCVQETKLEDNPQ